PPAACGSPTSRPRTARRTPSPPAAGGRWPRRKYSWRVRLRRRDHAHAVAFAKETGALDHDLLPGLQSFDDLDAAALGHAGGNAQALHRVVLAQHEHVAVAVALDHRLAGQHQRLA